MTNAYPYRSTPDVIRVGALQVDALCSEAHYGGTSLDLTWAQRRVLFVLLERQGRIVDRGTLYRDAFGRTLAPGSRAVDGHVGRIRRALAGTCPDAIVTVDRVGYRIDPAALPPAESTEHLP